MSFEKDERQLRMDAQDNTESIRYPQIPEDDLTDGADDNPEGAAETAAPENKIYIGSLALHDINGVTKIVRNLSFGSSKALDAIIAGTEQPNPNNKGINALPDKPILPITESIT